MKAFERILMKIMIIQFAFLVIAQLLILYSPLKPYLTKVIDYEGVSNEEETRTIETFYGE